MNSSHCIYGTAFYESATSLPRPLLCHQSLTSHARPPAKITKTSERWLATTVELPEVFECSNARAVHYVVVIASLGKVLCIFLFFPPRPSTEFAVTRLPQKRMIGHCPRQDNAASPAKLSVPAEINAICPG